MARHNEKTMSTDSIVGANIHTLRILKGWSREQLAVKIGVTHQQLKKYETSENRIAAGRLKEVADAFYKPVGWFFNETNIIVNPRSRLAIELYRAFNNFTTKQQDAFVILARSL